MTRMLFWNVEQFRDEKFYSTSTDPDPLATPKTKQAAAVDRLRLLQDVIERADPDILVIIETTAKKMASDLVAPNGGLIAALNVLTWLRGAAPPAVRSIEWRLIPPMYWSWQGSAGAAGINETVSVLYRGERGATRRFFTGPNLWGGGTMAASLVPPAPGAGAVPYGPYGDYSVRRVVTMAYSRFLDPPGGDPALATVPVGALHNAGKLVNSLAARVQFESVPGAAIDFGVDRPPYMVTFTEQTGAALRDLTVFVIHAPSKLGLQAPFLAKVATVPQISAPRGGNETRVIGGDFNENLLDATGALGTFYNPLTTLPTGYELLLAPAPGAVPPANLEPYLGYFATALTPLKPRRSPDQASKFLWSDAGNLSYYPRYGYQPRDWYSIDNVLVAPRIGGRDYLTTIFNPVVSSPMNAVAAPIPGNPPIGSLASATAMPNVPAAWRPWPMAPTLPTYDPAASVDLLAWDQYGHISSTSDHFAVFVDV